jgi:hypothetical protein
VSILGRLPGAVLSLARLRAVFHSAVLAPISLGVCNTESATSNSRCIGQRYVLPSKRPGSISSAADLQIGHVAIAFPLLFGPPSRSATNSLSSLALPNNAGEHSASPATRRFLSRCSRAAHPFAGAMPGQVHVATRDRLFGRSRARRRHAERRSAASHGAIPGRGRMPTAVTTSIFVHCAHYRHRRTIDAAALIGAS